MIRKHDKLKHLCLLVMLASTTSLADVRLPRLVSDGVVLQRDRPVAIWGWADDGETVTVALDGQAVGDVVARDGKWRLTIGSNTAGGPHTIDVSGRNHLVVRDVYFGDVWIASGQSNMQLPMERVREKYEDVIAAANLPLIRHFTVPREYEFKGPRADLGGGQWQVAMPETVLDLSAVGFFFAKSITESSGVPVGIISSNFGGSAAESWMSEQALESYPHYLAIARGYRDDAYLSDLLAEDRAVADAWYAALDARDAGLSNKPGWFAPELDDSGWSLMSVPGFWADTAVGPVNGAVWFRRTFEVPAELAGKPAKLMLGRIVDADMTYINGQAVGNVTYQYPPRRYQVDANILKAGANSIAVRIVNSVGKGGFITDKPYWLQVGDHRIDLQGQWRVKVGAVSQPITPPKFINYKQPLGFFNAMLAPLLSMTIKGVIWYQGESNVDRPAEYGHLFPAMIRNWREAFAQGDFPFLFVQLANFQEAVSEPRESAWAETRNAQMMALKEPNTAMVVTIDVGEWNDIHPLDKRTVGERLALAARHVAYGDDDLVYSGPLARSATACAETVVLAFDHSGDGLTVQGDELQGFALAGADKVFKWADARISGGNVLLQSGDVESPQTVRYAWADNPATANLYNTAGLPASPFEAAVGNGGPVCGVSQ